LGDNTLRMSDSQAFKVTEYRCLATS
jgi:hypothetical protein